MELNIFGPQKFKIKWPVVYFLCSQTKGRIKIATVCVVFPNSVAPSYRGIFLSGRLVNDT